MASILVIDDESNIRITIRLALEYVGHEVDLAVSGKEALRMMSRKEYDLILLDQRMPEMEGLQVLRRIRQSNPEARIIMITAFGTVEMAVEAMKLGADHVLRKPFTVDTLRRAVQAALKAPEAAGDVASEVTYATTTLNGFRIEYQPGHGERADGESRYLFTVRDPCSIARTCQVVLPDFIRELVKAHAGVEEFDDRGRIWEALCETALAEYLYQTAELPPEDGIRIDDLSAGLRKWLDAVLSRG